MAQQGIYRNPIFLNSVTHRSVRVAPVSNYLFAKTLNSVVIVGQEFLESAKFYPVVFTRSKDQEIVPVTILGLRDADNLFVSEEGAWKDGAYVPAFFRRYPFILASNVDQDGSFAVCVDSQFEGFGKKDGMALFNEKGEVTEEFGRVIEFLKNYQAQHTATKDMIRLLEEYGLFKDVSANITLPAGEKLGFAGLMMIDEMAMLNLEDGKVLNLFRRGFLSWIYAHLYSLSNFRVLMVLAAAEAEKGKKTDNPAGDKPKEKDPAKPKAEKPAK
jgi:hypothetical protein